MRYISILFIFCCLTLNGQTKWIKDKTTGCKVQNPYPKEYESISWSGDCIDSIANGYGTLIWKLHGKEKNCRYVGNMVNGLPEGQGEYILDKDLKYSGEFKNGKLNGKGNKISENYRYEGEFKDNELNGYGKLYKNDKLQYEGEFINSVENGKGKLYENDGSVFEGIFEKGYYKKGKLTSVKGYVIEGDWNGYELIEGSFLYPDGRVYVGHLKKWQPDGQGKMIYPNGDIQVGLWKKGKLIKRNGS